MTNEEFQSKLDEIHGENNFKLVSNYYGTFEEVNVKCNKCGHIATHKANYFIYKRYKCVNCNKRGNKIKRTYDKKLVYKGKKD